MSALAKLIGWLIVLGLTAIGIADLTSAQAHGDSYLSPLTALAIPLLVFGWLVVRVGALFIRRWRIDGSKAQKALVGLMAVVLAGGGLVAYVQATVPSQRPNAKLTAALAPACQGSAVPGAGHVDQTGSRINHLVVLDTVGNEHEWTGYPPLEWRPVALDDTDYVACVSPEEIRTVIQTCRYVNGPAITRYRASRDVKVVEALTGKVVASYAVSDDARACGQSEQRDLTELSGEVPWSMLAQRCSSLVEPGGTVSPTTSADASQTAAPSPTSSTPTPTELADAIELTTAVDLGLVDATLKGDGLQSVSIELASLSAADLLISVAAGTWFDPQRDSTQSMVAIANLEVAVAPGESGTWSVKAACGEMRRDQPGDADRFTVRAEPADGDLAMLLSSSTFAEQTFRTQQFAIWTLTNDPARGNYAALGSQYSVFGTGPSREELAAVRDILEQAGIDPSDYRAFR